MLIQDPEYLYNMIKGQKAGQTYKLVKVFSSDKPTIRTLQDKIAKRIRYYELEFADFKKPANRSSLYKTIIADVLV